MDSPINPGAVVIVDWRDKHYASEPGRMRPAIVLVTSPSSLSDVSAFTVVPLTGDSNLAPPSLSRRVDPDDNNGLRKPSYALAWNVQTVAKERITTTTARVTRNQLSVIREVLVEYITAAQMEEEVSTDTSEDSSDDQTPGT